MKQDNIMNECQKHIPLECRAHATQHEHTWVHLNHSWIMGKMPKGSHTHTHIQSRAAAINPCINRRYGKADTEGCMRVKFCFVFVFSLFHSLFRCARNSLGIWESWRWKTMAMPCAVSMAMVTVTATAIVTATAASTATATACADDVATTALALTSTAMLGSWLNAASCCCLFFLFNLFVVVVVVFMFWFEQYTNFSLSFYLKFPPQRHRHSYIVYFICYCCCCCSFCFICYCCCFAFHLL